MLAPADAEVARRDPAVPGMALVLDPEALAERLRAARPHDAVVSARATYVRYKPGTSCLVGYELERSAGSTVAFAAKAYRRGDGAKLAKARTRGGAGDVVTFDAELVTVVSVEGDRDLPMPGRLARPDTRRRLLRGLLPGRSDLWEAMPRCLRYKPERRWVGVVERDGRPVALVKAYRRSELAPAAAGLSFANTTPLLVPQLLGKSGRAGALASSWLPGVPLSDVLAVPLVSAAPLGPPWRPPSSPATSAPGRPARSPPRCWPATSRPEGPPTPIGWPSTPPPPWCGWQSSRSATGEAGGRRPPRGSWPGPRPLPEWWSLPRERRSGTGQA